MRPGRRGRPQGWVRRSRRPRPGAAGRPRRRRRARMWGSGRLQGGCRGWGSRACSSPGCGLGGQAELDAEPFPGPAQLVVDGALVLQAQQPGDPGAVVTDHVAQDDDVALAGGQVGYRGIQAAAAVHQLQLVAGRIEDLGGAQRPVYGAVDHQGRWAAVGLQLCGDQAPHDGPGLLFEVAGAQQGLPAAEDLQEAAVHGLHCVLVVAEVDLGVVVEGRLVAQVEGFVLQRQVRQGTDGLAVGGRGGLVRRVVVHAGLRRCMGVIAVPFLEGCRAPPRVVAGGVRPWHHLSDYAQASRMGRPGKSRRDDHWIQRVERSSRFVLLTWRYVRCNCTIDQNRVVVCSRSRAGRFASERIMYSEGPQESKGANAIIGGSSAGTCTPEPWQERPRRPLGRASPNGLLHQQLPAPVAEMHKAAVRAAATQAGSRRGERQVAARISRAAGQVGTATGLAGRSR
ncbi:hypothetical protein SCOCK_300065 [Actinacidiphila cocklensis]|uniref:Uncharacterized protein n=1 Tax=Actinacidiphila cocklensis TaxID=887465 RepID=A0A9W4GSF0_9ACTN|nr:hypothetical protein SCOCK_300065 [Actinacidiphila cocklensis]